jgi:hypothetical protein
VKSFCVKRLGLSLRVDDEAEVELAAREALREAALGAVNDEAHVRRRGAEARDEVGDEHAKEVVGSGDLEAARGAEGVERRGADPQVDEARRDVGDGRAEGLGAGRGEEAPSGADEERVAEDGAETIEGVADGRLGAAEARRRAGDAGLFEQHGEHDEEVLVDAG